jgi:hypothetical protein
MGIKKILTFGKKTEVFILPQRKKLNEVPPRYIFQYQNKLSLSANSISLFSAVKTPNHHIMLISLCHITNNQEIRPCNFQEKNLRTNSSSIYSNRFCFPA